MNFWQMRVFLAVFRPDGLLQNRVELALNVSKCFQYAYYEEQIGIPLYPIISSISHSMCV